MAAVHTILAHSTKGHSGGSVEDLANMSDDTKEVDRSDEADARRLRWLLNGNGYFMEEESLCGRPPCNESEQDDARRRIDEAMSASQ